MSTKLPLYIRNLKYTHLTSVFRQHNIHLVSTTCQHKYKWILCIEKPVLNASFQDFRCPNINIHLFYFEKTISTYLKAKNSLHATLISSFKYVFIIFFEKKQMLKYTLTSNHTSFYEKCMSSFDNVSVHKNLYGHLAKILHTIQTQRQSFFVRCRKNYVINKYQPSFYHH